MNTILFIDNEAEKPMIACASFSELKAAKMRPMAASRKPCSTNLQPILAKMGINQPDRIINIENLNLPAVDLVIAFSNVNVLSPTLPGMPPVVIWNVPTPPPNRAVDEAWLQVIHQIKSLTRDLVDQGYIAALIQARKNSEHVMDSMQEGIIAHDLNRKIFFFNRAAEQITGFCRSEILGKDCHDIFSGGMCGGHCSFKQPSLPHKLPTSPYLLNITSTSGQGRQLEMNVVEIKNFLDIPIGVVASFRDFTKELELASQLSEADHFAGIIGKDPKMLGIYKTIKELASSNVSVQIQGESGTGKELVAQAIHSQGNRQDKLFVPINCGALPENLLEAELFGHVKGAFTGAVRDKKGRFELADGGTLFLDEIGDISPVMQVKLLRVLQDGTFQKVGGEKTIQVDVRIISATNKDLKKEINEGRFRQDLYYRICVAPIMLPPLRQRKNDIPALARFFLKTVKDEKEDRNIILAQDTLDALMSYDWPGNVRELQNVIRYLMFKCRDEVARPSHLPENIESFQVHHLEINRRKPRKKKLNRGMVEQALAQTNNNRVQAALLLGVGRATLYRFIAKHPDL